MNESAWYDKSTPVERISLLLTPQTKKKEPQTNGIDDADTRHSHPITTAAATTNTLGSSPSKDSFMNYFFGGASNATRPSLGPHEIPQQITSHRSLSEEIENEVETRFANHVSRNSANFLLS